MSNNDDPQMNLNEQRIEAMKEKLIASLNPSDIAIEDQSHLHAGHAGAKSGKGHFELHIESDAFNGQSLIARHRAVYAALGSLMESDIHALTIVATAPNDNAGKNV